MLHRGERPAVTGHDIADGVRGRQHRDDGASLADGVARRVGDLHAIARQRLSLLARPVPRPHLEPRGRDVPGDRAAHDPRSEDRHSVDFGHVRLDTRGPGSQPPLGSPADRARRGGSGALSPAIRSSGAERPSEGRGLRGQYVADGADGQVPRNARPRTRSDPEGSSLKR